MTLAGHITRLRTQWTDRFTETVAITAPSVRTYDRGTNAYTVVAGASRYSGVARVRRTLQGDEVVTGEAELDRRQFEMVLPYTVTDVEVDDQVSISAADDPALVGVTGRVFEVLVGGENVTRRVMFEEVTQ